MTRLAARIRFLSVLFTAAIVALSGEAGATAAAGPSAIVAIDGTVTSSTVAFRPDPKDPKLTVFEGASVGDGPIRFTMGGTMNSDPFISWSVGLTNFTDAAVTFLFTFTTPVVGGPYNEVRTSLAGTLTDGRGDGVAATVLQSSALLDSVLVPGSVIGSPCSYAPAGIGAVGACPPAPATQYGEAVVAVPSNFYALFTSTFELTLSAGDQASFQGSAILGVAEVPEPATAALLLAGLLLLVGVRRMR